MNIAFEVRWQPDTGYVKIQFVKKRILINGYINWLLFPSFLENTDNAIHSCQFYLVDILIFINCFKIFQLLRCTSKLTSLSGQKATFDVMKIVLFNILMSWAVVYRGITPLLLFQDNRRKMICIYKQILENWRKWMQGNKDGNKW